MKKVIIAEKPSVAKEFARVLKVNGINKNGYIESDDYIVTWCVGHLVTMSYPDKYDEKLKYWNLNTLPFIPKEYKYEVIEAVKKQFEIVKSILVREDIDTIYVCTDSGREGEYIYRLVDKQIGVQCKEKRRVWIDSQTEEAILNGIKEAKPLDEYNSLSEAAYLRAKEDYLIGINFSRVLSIKYAKGVAKKLGEDRVVISIGRVMTCVLGMIVEREREIRNFKKVKFYKINGKFGDNEESSFEAEWKVCEKSLYFESPKLYNETGFKQENDAKEAIIKMGENDPKGVITQISKKTQKENPMLLFNLAELQNECTKRFKISPDDTLQIAQTLYEKKLLTYPRTDARVLSTAIAKEISKNLNGIVKGNKDEKIKSILDKMIAEKYSTNIVKSKFVNDSKITDHYAIIPTGQGFENFNSLTDLQVQVYNLVVRRFLSIFYPPAEYSKVSITVNIGKEEFNASGKVCLKLGYLEAIKDDDKTDDKDGKADLEILKNLKKGQEIDIQELSIKEGETSPPSRYSSGSMILAMENAGKLIEDDELREQIKGSGIGTSATRAEIIKKLERIQYINLNKKTQILTPTEKGEVIYDIVKMSMPSLLNPKLTASWEKGLNLVAEKDIKSDEFMAKLENYISSMVNRVK